MFSKYCGLSYENDASRHFGLEYYASCHIMPCIIPVIERVADNGRKTNTNIYNNKF